MVKKSTEALGGTINVSSVEGEGSCFSLEFSFALAEPANNLSANNLKASSDGDLQSLATIKLKGSVLVAEDNALVAYVLKKLLKPFKKDYLFRIYKTYKGYHVFVLSHVLPYNNKSAINLSYSLKRVVKYTYWFP
jgi:hypothetical protein